MSISNTDALTRVIEHREIFHDEMLTLMRRIMNGEMSPVMIAALAIGLRVKKETVGEIAAAAQPGQQRNHPDVAHVRPIDLFPIRLCPSTRTSGSRH